MSKIYSTRWVLPISQPVIESGAVVIDGAQIAAVGNRTDLLAAFPGLAHEDFGNAAILPGLVNTHSHLELTVMRGFLERVEHDFFGWLRRLTVARLNMSDEDLFISAAAGALEAARAGITCLADSSSFATQSMRALKEAGLRGIVYQESFGPDPKLAAENVGKLRAQLDAMHAMQTELVRAGVSPHAPYTVSAPQLQMIARLAIAEALPLMMHAAESEAERDFMVHGTGPFADGLKARAIDWQAPGVSTVRYLHDHGVLETKPLLAHCIDVDENDLQLIKNAGAGIAHCPKSNAKLRHGHAPFADFIAQQINVGLGSDSVASNNVCDIFEEARFATLLALTGSEARVCAADALFAATRGGARVLGLGDRIGSLEQGMAADLAVVNLGDWHQQPVRDPVATLIFSSSGRDVLLTVIDGKEIYRRDIPAAHEKELQVRLDQVRDKLESASD
jgi:cytosine/adenosine deaminase-related metal-dependent hydrolase